MSSPIRLGNYTVVSTTDERTPHVASFVGTHQLLPRRALLKLADQEAAVALLREACLLEAMQHPGVVRVFESGRATLPARGAWIALELADGPTLQQLISEDDRDALDALVRAGAGAGPLVLLRELADVLDHAHRRGVIHAGLRPSRVVLTGATRSFPVCVVDWSDARAHDAAPAPYRPSVASWHYTSPELARGEGTDRVDVYALGVIAYQLLTGVLPFAGRAIDASAQHMPTEVHRPDLPREITQLVDQMLAFDQWDRPSAAEVATQLGWIVDTLATPAAPQLSGAIRIRRPRWTPALSFAPMADEAAGSTDPRDRR